MELFMDIYGLFMEKKWINYGNDFGSDFMVTNFRYEFAKVVIVIR